MKKQYKIELSQEERNQLTRLTTQGTEKVRKVKRAKILAIFWDDAQKIRSLRDS
jgi:hypothetical protein